jgi:murein DD-endopeptidase MepM/ murein hydrolase activator NlpD
MTPWIILAALAGAGIAFNRRRTAQAVQGGVTLPTAVWPLPDWPPGSIQEWRYGARSFGASRDDHVHGGIDLGPAKIYGQESRAYGARVLTPYDGYVDAVDVGWDGPEAKRIDVITPHGRLVFGAVQPEAAVKPGDRVLAGQLIGWIGKYPGGSTMLHLEQHEGERVRWDLGDPRPAGIIDPRDGVLRQWVR